MNQSPNYQTRADLEKDFMTMYVEVTTWEKFEDLSEEDQDALGTFDFWVPRHLPMGIAAAAALGAYHLEVPIEDTSCFEFAVFDEQGIRVQPDFDADCCELAEKYEVCMT